VDHDNTSGGTSGNPHGGSASTNHGNGSHNANFETNSGAQSRVDNHENKNNPHSSSADTNHGNGSHNTNFAVDGNPQPPENHGNSAHNVSYAVLKTGLAEFQGQDGSGTGIPSRNLIAVDIVGRVFTTQVFSSAQVTIEPSFDGNPLGNTFTDDVDGINDDSPYVVTYNNTHAFPASSVGIASFETGLNPDSVEWDFTYTYIE
jgi:hypothetical protein